LGGIGVTPFGYAWMVQGLRQIKDKLNVVLEGGYNLDSLAVSAEAVVKSLLVPSDKVSEINKLLGDYELQYNDEPLKEGNIYQDAIARAEE